MFLLGWTALFQQGVRAAQSTADAYDELWANIIGRATLTGDTLYGALATYGEVFAVMALCISLIVLFSRLEQGDIDAIAELVWPVLVVALLYNDGALLGQLTIDMRAIAAQTNDKVINSVYKGAALEQAYIDARNLSNTQSSIGGFITQCQALQGDKQLACIDKALADAQALINSSATPGALMQQKIQNFIDDINKIRQQATANPGSFFTPNSPIYWTIFGPAWEATAYSILWVAQIAFQHMIEIAQILTALAGPIAVGGSTLPVGWSTKPLIAWITGFMTLSSFKLGFNISAGLSASVFLSAESTDPLYFPFFVAICAPILGVAIASLGGVAVWMSLTSILRTTIGLMLFAGGGGGSPPAKAAMVMVPSGGGSPPSSAGAIIPTGGGPGSAGGSSANRYP